MPSLRAMVLGGTRWTAGPMPNIEYTYAFLTRYDGHACVVFRVEDNECVESILKQNGFVTLTPETGDSVHW